MFGDVFEILSFEKEREGLKDSRDTKKKNASLIRSTSHLKALHLKKKQTERTCQSERIRAVSRKDLLGMAVVGELFEGRKGLEGGNILARIIFSFLFFLTNENCLLIVQLIGFAAIYLQTEHAIFHERVYVFDLDCVR